MVAAYLTLGALVGVVLSAGFLYVEVGRFATPQVPETRFDERKELFAYTAGLFAGVPLAVAYYLYVLAMTNAALLGAILFLALLVGGTELGQWALLRTSYFGRGPSGPFYALGFRAAVGGLIGLALVAAYLSVPGTTWDGVALALLQAAAVLGIEVTAALLSLRPTPDFRAERGGASSGAVFQLVGFLLLGLGVLGGEATALGGAAVALLGSLFVYRGRRHSLDSVPPPSRGRALEEELPPATYRRVSRP